MTKSTIIRDQKMKLPAKVYTENGTKYRIKPTIRYDDDCGNGHNSFAITADIDRQGNNGRWYEDACGCCHDEFAKHYPKYAHLLKWHLCSSDGPMHYVANTLHHANNLDCWGKKAGEPKTWVRELQFNGSPFGYQPNKYLWAVIDEMGIDADWANLELIEIEHEKRGGYDFKPKITFAVSPETVWYKCAFDDTMEADKFVYAMTKCEVQVVKTCTAWGEGSERNFEAARHCAVWPEATDEQLTAPKEELTRALEARLPALIEAFAADMIALGFAY